MIAKIESSRTIHDLADRLAKTSAPALDARIALLHRWGELLHSPRCSNIEGVPFLRLWLRRATLESVVERELGPEKEDWRASGSRRIRPLPLGISGHWPAANVPIQPILSASCGFLAGNSCLVRVPSSLQGIVERLIEPLEDSDLQSLRSAMSWVAFDHSRDDLQMAMASRCDAALHWGGEEALRTLRALPYPHSCRILSFGPRISLAVMDQGAISSASLPGWCQRLARDVWQFDQMACSSPQILLVPAAVDTQLLRDNLVQAFRREAAAHPFRSVDPTRTASIVKARQEWLLVTEDRRADFDLAPEWTILWGTQEDLPGAVQGRTLFVMRVPDLEESASRLDRSFQTIGLAVEDPDLEIRIRDVAARQGIDRIVRIGHMHTFDSPWDGHRIVHDLVRWTTFQPSRTTEQQS